MKPKNKYSLNIQNYSENAAKNFSFLRLSIYTIISLVLSILLFVDAMKQNYQGKALLFTGVAFILIFGYTILNIKAIIYKLKR